MKYPSGRQDQKSECVLVRPCPVPDCPCKSQGRHFGHLDKPILAVLALCQFCHVISPPGDPTTMIKFRCCAAARAESVSGKNCNLDIAHAAICGNHHPQAGGSGNPATGSSRTWSTGKTPSVPKPRAAQRARVHGGEGVQRVLVSIQTV